MSQQIKIANWLLEVDVEKTKAYYEKGIEVCDCLYCNNFVEVTKELDAGVLELFHRLGINPAMPAELSEFLTTNREMHKYIGSYHLVGKLLEGNATTSDNWNETNTIKIEKFTFAFTNELEFLPEDFPVPALQLDFEVDIPWVLEEQPD